MLLPVVDWVKRAAAASLATGQFRHVPEVNERNVLVFVRHIRDEWRRVAGIFPVGPNAQFDK